MKPAPFDFVAPDSLQGVLLALAKFGGDARVLAGGQSLVPLMNLRLVRPEVLVSINRCAELDYFQVQDGHLVLGARVRQAMAEEASETQANCPLLAAVLPHVGAQANRNRGTVCGSLAHADPLAELPALALALDAEMLVASAQSRRRVAAEDFFLGELSTALHEGELLEAVAFARQDPSERHAFLELGNRRHGFAVAGVAVRLRLSEGRCDLARIAMIGAGPMARRIKEAEAALLDTPVDEAAIRSSISAVAHAVEPPSDVHADAEYRRHVLGVLLDRALRQAVA